MRAKNPKCAAISTNNKPCRSAASRNMSGFCLMHEGSKACPRVAPGLRVTQDTDKHGRFWRLNDATEMR